MSAHTFYVQLECRPGPRYPYSEFGCLYQLFLPLGADGRVHGDAFRQDSDGYRGTRFRASDGEAVGRVLVGKLGRFVLEYDDLRFYPSTLLLDSTAISVGTLVQIAEHDGQIYDCRVISTRAVRSFAAAGPTGSRMYASPPRAGV